MANPLCKSCYLLDRKACGIENEYISGCPCRKCLIKTSCRIKCQTRTEYFDFSKMRI